MHEDKMLKHKRDFDAKRRAEALDRKRRENLAAMRAVGGGVRCKDHGKDDHVCLYCGCECAP